MWGIYISACCAYYPDPCLSEVTRFDATSCKCPPAIRAAPEVPSQSCNQHFIFSNRHCYAKIKINIVQIHLNNWTSLLLLFIYWKQLSFHFLYHLNVKKIEIYFIKYICRLCVNHLWTLSDKIIGVKRKVTMSWTMFWRWEVMSVESQIPEESRSGVNSRQFGEVGEIQTICIRVRHREDYCLCCVTRLLLFFSGLSI